MNFFDLIFSIIVSGLRLEVSNQFFIKNNEIIIKFADGTKASIFLKINYIDLFLKNVRNKYLLMKKVV